MVGTNPYQGSILGLAITFLMSPYTTRYFDRILVITGCSLAGKVGWLGDFYEARQAMKELAAVKEAHSVQVHSSSDCAVCVRK